MIFEAWIKCREWLLPAIELTNGTHNEDDVLRELMRGKLTLWPGERSAIVTEFVEYDTGKKKTLHFFLVGGDMDELLAMEPKIAEWGKSKGCGMMSCAGRKGWEKVLEPNGYKLGCVYLYKDL